MEHVAVVPPMIPGAKYVGDEMCATCHEKVAHDFKRTSHGMRVLKEKGETKGCESCHGPGSLHAEADGAKGKILKGNWEMCYSCHQRVRSEFALQYHHPIPEGRIGCNDCHTIHGPVKAGIRTVSKETCYKCHQQIRGPWTFEHEPVEQEDCDVCHNAHGSINNRLLIERDYNLCLKCHYSTAQFQAVGHYAHRRALNPSSVPGGGRYSTCLGCHRGVHGSNFSKELRSQ
ncbi:MAG: hypothetical protein A2107_02190 [Verrucomicrobia bacterium GWF2_62_7]|nr:MAG: hypothetical protein A2107_02190 [Verrucomicrobia bacterium GWF2_62_7]